MTLWWVNLGAEYAAQRRASALWCPNRTITRRGLAPAQWHWSLITEVKPQELIVLSRDGFILGLGKATEAARPNQPKPEGFDLRGRWHHEGWLLPIQFLELSQKRPRAEVTRGLFLNRMSHSPLLNTDSNGSGRGNQIYFGRVPEEDADLLEERLKNLLYGDAALNQISTDGLPPASDESGAAGFSEGQKRNREATFFTRSPKLVARAKQIYGSTCMVCGFNFGERYGSIGEGFIECHHLNPLSERDQADLLSHITNIDEVAVVCSNCHRMLHRNKDVLPLDHLREMLRPPSSR